jgi:hypothetical protein
MTTPGAPAAHRTEASELDAFLELMYADEELLRSEFEDIVGAEWPRRPSRRAVVHKQHGGNGGPAPGRTHRGSNQRPAHRRLGIDAAPRQRSPPMATS